MKSGPGNFPTSSTTIFKKNPFPIMAVHPIRSATAQKEMRAVWSEQNRFSYHSQGKVALAKAEAVCGMIPPTAATEIEENHGLIASGQRHRAQISHNMMAIVKAIPEVCGESGCGCIRGNERRILDTESPPARADHGPAHTKQRFCLPCSQAGERQKRWFVARTHGSTGADTTASVWPSGRAMSAGYRVAQSSAPGSFSGRSPVQWGRRRQWDKGDGSAGRDDGEYRDWPWIETGDLPRPVRGILHVLRRCRDNARQDGEVRSLQRTDRRGRGGHRAKQVGRPPSPTTAQPDLRQSRSAALPVAGSAPPWIRRCPLGRACLHKFILRAGKPRSPPSLRPHIYG